MTGYIYKYYNVITNKVYIGQTTDLINRMSSHRNKSKYEKNKFYNSVRKYGWESFVFSVEAIISAPKEFITEYLDNTEILYIKFYDSYRNGYNSTLGGHSARGMKRSAEYKEYCRNRQYSESTRMKMSESARGRKLSEETKNKIRESSKRITHFKDRHLYKEKAKEARKKVLSKAVSQLDSNSNIIAKFDSVLEAASFIKETYAPELKLSGVLRTLMRRLKNKTKIRLYHGFIWKYET